jgi:cytochrome o ubiquinol oxidase subunit 1
VILAGIVLTVVQLVVSVRQRERRRDTTGDPWDGRTLEWATPSPPPPWNFTRLPQVDGLDTFWVAKRRNGGALAPAPGEGRQPLALPRPSAVGVVVAFFAFVGGFAAVWHIGWLAGVGLAGCVATGLARAWQTEHELEIDPAAVAGLGAQRGRA